MFLSSFLLKHNAFSQIVMKNVAKSVNQNQNQNQCCKINERKSGTSFSPLDVLVVSFMLVPGHPYAGCFRAFLSQVRARDLTFHARFSVFSWPAFSVSGHWPGLLSWPLASQLLSSKTLLSAFFACSCLWERKGHQQRIGLSGACPQNTLSPEGP